MKKQPVAIFGGISELEARVKAGHHDFAIMLAGGAAFSRKTIRRDRQGCWLIKNHIDDTKQHFCSVDDLWSESHIGEALDKNALLDLEGDIA